MPKTLSEIDKLEQWLRRQNMNPSEAKAMLQQIRNQKSREYSTFKHNFSGRRVKIGVLGDTHMGNKWTDLRFLEDVMRRFKKEKVEAVYHTGDLTDGPWQRHHNVLEQYAHGFDAQVRDFVDHFPDINRPIFIIDGNHDGWYRKGEGAIVGAEVDLRRKDITYLGDDEALIKIGRLEIMLSHPDDGNAYAYSYKAQKFIEALVKMGERIPEVILQGHYHKIFHMMTSGTHYFGTGTTCRQTPWMRNRKIAADMGAWELDLYRDSRGNLTKLISTLLSHTGENHRRAIK
jgi:predicted phosphodiesterase